MHVTVTKKPFALKSFSGQGDFSGCLHTQLTLQQFVPGDDDAEGDSDEELTLELRERGEGGDAGDVAGVGAGRHVTKWRQAGWAIVADIAV